MGTILIGTLLLFVCNTHLISAKAHHNKKESYGFQGVRGKREVGYEKQIGNDYLGLNQPPDNSITTTIQSADASDEQHPNPDSENSSNNNNDLFSNTYEVNGQTHYYRDLPNLSIAKRAPSGFLGMRGKKDDEFSMLDKRAPMGFQGMRGKKFLLNYPIRYIPKRAPSGFLGMRGKKLFVNELYVPKRAPSGFLGMRGKKSFTDDINPEDEENDEENQLHESDYNLFELLLKEREILNEIRNSINPEYSEETMEKRGPSGFMGMRGKKYYDDDLYEGEFEKRAPSGFMGMRGKKSVNNEDYFQDKRAPSGFLGMRGKKENMIDDFDVKRAPANGFFGMRGKKEPMVYLSGGQSFFGTRGKKGPFEFRGKFVGVRGKKDQQFKGDSQDFQGFQPANLIEASPVKRLPSGFVGMRGKKWPDTTLAQ